jgi:replicative DNA helicase
VTKIEPKDLVFNPEQATTHTVDFLEYIHDNKDRQLPLGIEDIDKALVPMLPPDIAFVIANSSNGKTSLLSWWSRSRGQWLKKMRIKRVPVYISWETAVERVHMLHIAAAKGIPIDVMARGNMSDAQWADVMDFAGGYSEHTNLWYIGNSLEVSRKNPGNSMSLEVRHIRQALMSIIGSGYQIDSIFCDYLQEIPVYPPTEGRVLGITQTASQLKQLGFEFSCPIVVATQANNQVVDTDWKIPGKGDSEWGNVDKIADYMLSLMKPSVYWAEGTELFDGTIVRGKCQLLLKCVKQKFGDLNWYEWLHFDATKNTFGMTARRTIEL